LKDSANTHLLQDKTRQIRLIKRGTFGAKDIGLKIKWNLPISKLGLQTVTFLKLK